MKVCFQTGKVSGHDCIGRKSLLDHMKIRSRKTLHSIASLRPLCMITGQDDAIGFTAKKEITIRVNGYRKCIVHNHERINRFHFHE